MNLEESQKWMSMVLELAKRGLGRVEPNPMVGAVLVKNGIVVGLGWHQEYGGPHAEIFALKQAGAESKGSTLYVSLEPCCHFGKTPPCSDSIIQSGIAKVVVAMCDPNPLVSGKGIAHLQSHGIIVELGIEKEKAETLNAAFIKYVVQSKPFVIAKWAMSLDGKIATKSGESKWISNEKSRTKVHDLRRRMDAILVGVGTVEKDDPMLNARPDGIRKQLRIVIDPYGRISLTSKIVQTAKTFSTLIVLSKETSGVLKKKLIDFGVEILEIIAKEPKEIVEEILLALGKKGIQNLLVEGGGSTLGYFFDAQQIDEVQVFIGSFLIGGTDAKSPIGGCGILEMVSRHKLSSFLSEIIDDNYFISGRLKSYSSKL